MYTRNQLQLYWHLKRQRIVIADIADREIVLMRAKQPIGPVLLQRIPPVAVRNQGLYISNFIVKRSPLENSWRRAKFVASLEQEPMVHRARCATRWTSKIGKSLSTTVRYHVFLRLPCDKGIIIQKVYCQ